jgi:hypothetical protein
MSETVSGRRALKDLAAAAAAAFSPGGIRGQSAPIRVAGMPVEIVVASISPVTVRITVSAIVGTGGVLEDGALVAAAEGKPLARRRTAAAFTAVHAGNLSVRYTADPPAIHVDTSKGQPVQRLGLSAEEPGLSFLLSTARCSVWARADRSSIARDRRSDAQRPGRLPAQDPWRTRPKGSWFDYWTEERVAGGRELERAVNLETMPLHVRAGAIIPHAPVRQYVDQPGDEPLTVVVYPGADGAFVLYEDDGRTFEHRHGAFMRIVMTWDDRAGRLSLRLAPGSRMRPPLTRQVRVRLAGSKEEQSVRFDGKPVTITLSQQTRTTK